LTGQVLSDFVLVECNWQSDGPEGTSHIADVPFQGEDWPVIVFDSELALRGVLLRGGHRHAVLVYRPRDGFNVSLDIKARSFGESARTLGLGDLLAAHTGLDWPPEVDYEDWRPSVEQHLNDLVAQAQSVQQPLFQQITLSQVETFLVRAAFGITVPGHDTADLLLQLAQSGPTTPPSNLELSLLRRQLAEQGTEHAEIVVWAGEEPGRAQRLLITGAVMRATHQAGIPPGWGNLASLRNRLIAGARDMAQAEAEAVVQVIDLTLEVLRRLGRTGRRLARKAEQQEAVQGLPPAYNDVLPRALYREIERLAERMAGGETAAAREVARLEDHLFATEEHDSLKALGLMSALVRWLDGVSSQTAHLSGPIQWVGWYRDQGAYADLTALRLMNLLPRVARLQNPTNQLLERFWEQRDALNQAFARAFLADYEHAIHSPKAVASHRVVERVVEPILRQSGRALLVILDGCAYPSYLHLLEALAERSIGPREEYLALSLLPSITSVSRKAIFLARLPTDPFDTEEEYEAKAKAREEDALKRRLARYSVEFFNKTRLTEQGAGPLVEAIHGEVQLVTVIVNDIDDRLKTPGASPKLHDLDDLPVFWSVVQEALNAWRTVILTADHGHTWHLSKSRRRGPRPKWGGHRFFPWQAGQPLEDWTLGSTSELIPCSPGAEGSAFLYRCGDYLGQQPRPGYHGGAALEELVVPCAVLAKDVPPKTQPGWLQGETPVPTTEAPLQPLRSRSIQLTLSNGQTRVVELSFDLDARERLVLQTLVQYGRANEAQLREQLGTRRVAGIVAGLIEKLAQAGMDWIEQRPAGPGGTEYVFRREKI
jgi:predicted transcriptional regulator